MAKSDHHYEDDVLHIFQVEIKFKLCSGRNVNFQTDARHAVSKTNTSKRRKLNVT